MLPGGIVIPAADTMPADAPGQAGARTHEVSTMARVTNAQVLAALTGTLTALDALTSRIAAVEGRAVSAPTAPAAASHVAPSPERVKAPVLTLTERRAGAMGGRCEGHNKSFATAGGYAHHMTWCKIAQ